jgi:hypothetical protein
VCSSWWNRNEGFDEIPKRIRKQPDSHGVHVTARRRGRLSVRRGAGRFCYTLLISKQQRGR